MKSHSIRTQVVLCAAVAGLTALAAINGQLSELCYEDIVEDCWLRYSNPCHGHCNIPGCATDHPGLDTPSNVTQIRRCKDNRENRPGWHASEHNNSGQCAYDCPLVNCDGNTVWIRMTNSGQATCILDWNAWCNNTNAGRGSGQMGALLPPR